jgi:predicted DNA-binding transcriptional regulator AlpA
MSTPTFYRMADLASTKNRSGMIPVTASTIRKWVADGKFPAPRRLSQGVTVWIAHDIHQWIVSNSRPDI